jgi:hypothetical protein
MKTLKTFILARAIAGEPIQTRDGRPAKFIAHVPEAAENASKLVILLDGEVLTYYETGSFTRLDEHMSDLCMAPTVTKKWLNVYKHESGYTVGNNTWASQDEAHAGAKGSIGRIACIQIEFTEGEGL